MHPALHTALGDHEADVCPRCHRQRLVRLRSMSRHSQLDWFKCDGCDHLFTREPASAGKPDQQQAAAS